MTAPGQALGALTHARNMRLAALVACILSTCAAGAMLLASRTALSLEGLPMMAAIILLLFALHVAYGALRPNPPISLACGGLAAVIWAGTAAGITALAALRLHAPLVDAALASADAFMGVDTPGIVAWAARTPWASRTLNAAYLSTVPLVFAALLFLAWTRREARLWELCLSFAGLGMACAVLSGFFPAVGAFVHHEVPPGTLALLPGGSGIYHLPTFAAYRSGALGEASIRHMEGVVTFPSFHTAMALMTGYAFRGLRWLSVLAWVWSGLTVASTVPIGGHYVIDLLAGGAAWGVLALAVRGRPWRLARAPAGTVAPQGSAHPGPCGGG